jgi:hypothetical protein
VIKDVEYEPHHFKGISPLLRDFKYSDNVHIFGADTETFHGKPLSLQLAGPSDELFTYADKGDILPTFYNWIFGRARCKGINIVYFHNLRFDLRILFADHLLKIYEQFSDIYFETTIQGITIPPEEYGKHLDRVEVKLLYGKVNKATFIYQGTVVHVFDSLAFTQASLARSLKMFGVPVKKSVQPEGIGRIDVRRLPKADPYRLAFEGYAIQDARAERLLGLKLMDFHKEYGIAPSLSLPSFAARVFRKKFLMPSESIPFPPIPCVKASEFSFHGGENFYAFNGPRIIEDVYEADISSAYPFAMSELPGQTSGEFLRVNKFRKGRVGVYCLSGVVPEGEYPLVFSHDFKPLPPGEPFADLWHGSYETEIILKCCKSVKVIDGWIWQPDKNSKNRLGDYARFFYRKKQETPKTDPSYHFYKIMLNALFGKTVSTIALVSDELREEIAKLQASGVDVPDNMILDERFDEVLGKYVKISHSWKAGAFYNPFWGTLITSHCRAYLHGLMTKYGALHAATDAIKTTSKVKASEGLGGIKLEAFGRCLFFRNKLYLHFSKGFNYCGHDLKNPEKHPYKYPPKHPKAGQFMLDHDGQHLCKVAMHGFKGPLDLLFDNRESLFRTRMLKYTYEHVVGLREGLKREETPGDFVDREEILEI